MKRLIVLRHGQTAWNDENRVQGSADIELNEAGRAQARAAAVVLARAEPSLVVASDMRRAGDTAAVIAEAAGLEVRVDKRLRERSYGPWEGLTRPEIAERFPAEFEQWEARRPFHLDGMELLDEVADRTAAALADVAAEPGDGTAIVVTHGGSSRQGVVRFLDWDQQLATTIFGLGNCHWADLRRTVSGWRMYGYNLSASPASGTIPEQGASKPV